MMTKSLRFEFPYIRGRPLVTAKLRYGRERARYFSFLVDTGADYTLISKSNAVLLGIDLAKLKKEKTKVELANLSFIEAYRVRLEITLGDLNFKIPVLVADEEVECLLGRKGVFDKFDVLFKERERILVFENLGPERR